MKRQWGSRRDTTSFRVIPSSLIIEDDNLINLFNVPRGLVLILLDSCLRSMLNLTVIMKRIFWVHIFFELLIQY